MSRRSGMRMWRATCVMVLTTAAGLIVMAAPAQASCVGPPARSSHPFTGTVLSVQRDGLIATVKTDEGATVVVRGTPSDTGVTSVDRTFTAGARYEFHPVNGANPFDDNACTATRLLDGGVGGGAVDPDQRSTGWDVTASVLLALAVAAAAAGVVLLIRRRRRWPVGPAAG